MSASVGAAEHHSPSTVCRAAASRNPVSSKCKPGSNGQVSLPSFQAPPQPLLASLTGQTDTAKALRNNFWPTKAACSSPAAPPPSRASGGHAQCMHARAYVSRWPVATYGWRPRAFAQLRIYKSNYDSAAVGCLPSFPGCVVRRLLLWQLHIFCSHACFWKDGEGRLQQLPDNSYVQLPARLLAPEADANCITAVFATCRSVRAAGWIW